MPVEKLTSVEMSYEKLPRKTIESIRDPAVLGLWVYLMSKPPGWKIRPAQIQKHFGIGKRRYFTLMGKLREEGLVQTEMSRDDQGRITQRTQTVTYQGSQPQSTQPRLRVVQTEDNPDSGQAHPLDIREKTEIKEKSEMRERAKARHEGRRASPVSQNPPSLKDVQEFALSRGAKVDPYKFHDYYTTSGWVNDGGYHIYCWQNTFKKWEEREMERFHERHNDIRDPMSCAGI